MYQILYTLNDYYKSADSMVEAMQHVHIRCSFRRKPDMDLTAAIRP